MQNLHTSGRGDFRDRLRRAGNGIKRVGGTVLAGAIVTAVCFQAAPVNKAFAETHVKVTKPRTGVTKTQARVTKPRTGVAETQAKPETRQEVNVKATKTTIVDYPGGFSSSTPSTLKKRGVRIVVRYVGYQTGKYAWKNLRKSEADALRKNGIDIVSVYETTAGWMRGGYPAGVQAAKIAKADIAANGGPTKPFVYFACDEDANYTGQTNAALRGAASVLGNDKVGIYGGYTVVDSALKTRSAAKGWQTMAWSQGKVAENISLYQVIKPYAGNLGLDYDSNFPHHDDIGQWGTHQVTTGAGGKQATAVPRLATRVASKSAPTHPTLGGPLAMLFRGARH